MVLRAWLLDERKGGNLPTCNERSSQKTGENVHQLIISPIEAHSKKPDIAREKITALMGDLPKIELFARKGSPGWDIWGNEVKSSITL